MFCLKKISKEKNETILIRVNYCGFSLLFGEKILVSWWVLFLFVNYELRFLLFKYNIYIDYLYYFFLGFDIFIIFF